MQVDILLGTASPIVSGASARAFGTWRSLNTTSLMMKRCSWVRLMVRGAGATTGSLVLWSTRAGPMLNQIGLRARKGELSEVQAWRSPSAEFGVYVKRAAGRAVPPPRAGRCGYAIPALIEEAARNERSRPREVAAFRAGRLAASAGIDQSRVTDDTAECGSCAGPQGHADRWSIARTGIPRRSACNGCTPPRAKASRRGQRQRLPPCGELPNVSSRAPANPRSSADEPSGPMTYFTLGRWGSVIGTLTTRQLNTRPTYARRLKICLSGTADRGVFPAPGNGPGIVSG